MSLDGVIQGPGGPEEDTTGGFELGGWSATQWDDSMQQFLNEVMQQDYDLLLGRFTYHIWEPYWPKQTGPIAEKFNRIKKYVATRTLREAHWEGTVLLNDNAIEQVKALKAGDGPDLQMWGSADFIQSLRRYGLIDQMNIMIFPVVLGRGKRLFAEGTVPGNFKMTRHIVSTTGVVIATYEPDGEVPIGRAGGG
ncbi:dihydrofolate reductase [Dyadobacter beijingensis]|uniref:Dihydrofolate reductase n=2 Tax=Dyadobacter beijingensis TaxID=365489 RepID=A0ABQ2I2G2_9BACT|nr:dihydrofolate reductase [Dyadobacter beijingensis]